MGVNHKESVDGSQSELTRAEVTVPRPEGLI